MAENLGFLSEDAARDWMGILIVVFNQVMNATFIGEISKHIRMCQLGSHELVYR